MIRKHTLNSLDLIESHNSNTKSLSTYLFNKFLAPNFTDIFKINEL